MRKAAYLFFAALIVVFDQLSKWAVTEHVIRPLLEGDRAAPMGLIEWYMNTPEKLPHAALEIWPVFNIVMVWNSGISFGLFSQAVNYGPILLTGLAFIITLWFLIWLLRTSSATQSFSLALVIAGAIGNVIDRIRFGAVIDFLDFHIAGAHWPAFNIADSCVVVGVAVLILHSFLFEKNQQ